MPHRPRPFRIAALLLAGLAGCVLTENAFSFDMKRNAFSGGAVQVAGGSYRLQATVGEAGPVSEVVSGEAFTLGAGFWPGFALSDPSDAPTHPPGDALPGANFLAQNSPNPFRGPTSIEFAVAETENVRMAVYDAGGRRLATLAQGVYSPGHYRLLWLGGDDSGQEVSSGICFYRLEIGDWSSTRKMLKCR